MHPDEQYVDKYLDLYEHIDDPAYLKKTELFESWYENPIDLPGRWYLQVIRTIFKDNLLAKGRYVALGRTIDLKTITCPVYLLAGESDDITPREQVFAAEGLVGTPPGQIVKQLTPGGHIGLFMGSSTLRKVWPGIAHWIGAAR
jgi:poly(3-hydroxyalkanoate) synthetase